MKNLVLGYLHAPDRKKQEVLSLISKILGFTQEELDQVCVCRGGGEYTVTMSDMHLSQALGREAGWISRWWPRTPSTSPQPSTREVHSPPPPPIPSLQPSTISLALTPDPLSCVTTL